MSIYVYTSINPIKANLLRPIGHRALHAEELAYREKKKSLIDTHTIIKYKTNLLNIGPSC